MPYDSKREASTFSIEKVLHALNREARNVSCFTLKALVELLFSFCFYRKSASRFGS